MRPRSDWDRSLDRIDAGKVKRQLPNLWQSLQDSFPPQMSQIKEDAIVHSPPFGNLTGDRQRDSGSRGG